MAPPRAYLRRIFFLAGECGILDPFPDFLGGKVSVICGNLLFSASPKWFPPFPKNIFRENVKCKKCLFQKKVRLYSWRFCPSTFSFAPCAWITMVATNDYSPGLATDLSKNGASPLSPSPILHTFQSQILNEDIGPAAGIHGRSTSKKKYAWKIVKHMY